MITRTIHPQIRIKDAAKGICEYIASDESVDSYHEVIRADGWRFNRFQKNAPFVNSHRYGSIEDILGKVIDFRIEGRQLVETVQWAIDVEENSLARLGWKMLEAGYLKAVSVGFEPVKMMSSYNTDPGVWRKQVADLGFKPENAIRTIYFEQEQIELSTCVVGANSNAVAQKAWADGLFDDSEGECLVAHGVQVSSRRKVFSFVRQQSRGDFLNKLENTSKSMNSPLIPDQQILSDPSRLMPKTRTALERLTSVAEAGSSDVKLNLSCIQDLQQKLHLELHLAGFDPVQKLLANDDFRLAIDAAFRNACRGELSSVHRSGSLGSTTTPGSTLLAGEVANIIYDVLAAHGAWTSLNVVPIRTGYKSQTPIMSALPEALFVEGGDQIGEDATYDGSSKDLIPKLVAVMLYASLQMAEDASQDLASVLLSVFTRAIRKRWDWVAFMADGTADANDGGFTGLFAAGTAAAAAAGNTTIETLDFEDFLRCVTSLPEGVLDRPLRWWAHPLQLARMMAVKDGAGLPIFKTALQGPTGGAIGTILNYPVTPVSVASTVNAAGAKVACFGDPMAMAVGVRKEFAFQSADQFKFDYNRRYFRGFSRMAVKCLDATAIRVLTTAAA